MTWTPTVTEADKTPSTGGGFNSPYPYHEFDDGVVVEERPVVAAKLCRRPSGVTNWNDDEVGVEVTLETGPDEKLSFPLTLYFGGKYARDEAGRMTGWGAMFKLRNLFTYTGIIDEGEGFDPETGAVLPHQAQALVGKKLCYLRYPTAKRNEHGRVVRYSWDDLDVVGAVLATETFEDAATRLHERFVYSSKRGFPKNFRPMNKQSGDGAPSGTPGEATTHDELFGPPAAPTGGADDLSFGPEDDLPF